MLNFHLLPVKTLLLTFRYICTKRFSNHFNTSKHIEIYIVFMCVHPSYKSHPIRLTYWFIALVYAFAIDCLTVAYMYEWLIHD